MEFHSGSPEMDVSMSECAGVEEAAFVLRNRRDKGFRIEANYLVWAYDVWYHGWQHMVPFKIPEPFSGFGLAREAARWEAARKRDPTLEPNFMLDAACYSKCPGLLVEWDESAFDAWLTQTRNNRDNVGFRQGNWRNGRTIALSQVDAALNDLLESWPVNDKGLDFIGKLRRWWRNPYARSLTSMAGGDVSLPELHGLILKRLGTLRVPLDQVAKATRRNIRRQKIQERVAALTGIDDPDSDPGHTSLIQIIMSDSPPSHLVNISGNKFQIVAEAETDLRIQSRYLVWAYDILNHDWWSAVPEAVFSPGLSVFELAQKAWEWETNGGSIYTLSSSCYTCGEDGRKHPATESCERCEEPWSPEEFWEWLRSRHFQSIWSRINNLKKETHTQHDQSVSWEQVHRDRLREMIDEIGFDVPTGKGDSTFEMCKQDIEGFLPTVGYQSLFGRFQRLWMANAGVFKRCASGFWRWEHERLILHRVSSYSKGHNTLAISDQEAPRTTVNSCHSGVDSITCTGINDSIPAFRIIFPQEMAWTVDAGYLAWAFDIFDRDWWHLVPFEVSKPMSVFGLAQMAVKWEENIRAKELSRSSCILEARCYNPPQGHRVVWNAAMLSEWVTLGRSASDVGFRSALQNDNRTGWFIPVSQVNDALHDLLESWPVTQSHSCQFTENLLRWRSRYNHKINRCSLNGPKLSTREFERAIVEMLGDLRVPMDQVPKKMRRRRRRRQTCEKIAVLTGAEMNDPEHASFLDVMMSDSPPSHLMSISGNKFQVVKETETGMQIPSRYLVWAYDVLNHGLWGAVPESIFCSGMSVFGLAKKIWEWETSSGGRIYTLSASCYNCGERGRIHATIESCERCELWNSEEFWEWLRSRHFEHVCDQLKNNGQSSKDSRQSSKDSRQSSKGLDELSRDQLSQMIEEIGFELPSKSKGRKIKLCANEISNFLCSHPFRTTKTRTMLPEGFRHWLTRRKTEESPNDGVDRWEYERFIVHQMSTDLTNEDALNYPHRSEQPTPDQHRTRTGPISSADRTDQCTRTGVLDNRSIQP
ncbi:hypothetical protein GNI_087940 [Gregarina niphandrodes]|uniref:Uncharacterized protein n=1 Tax=Gregarina niphandrodes TaxID=110365 RepID=A0A023B5Q6_GRENI|nr:hypothetical protein GNI_087940 [Gregarina niphandrodes]EZG62558.1 hypothetical protein GNI_087940 [Gregarina niphandrodes]|eukprot:XP_011130727.1 hypothetical protein GNI_087940 [Gregarina niphandrodes]